MKKEEIWNATIAILAESDYPSDNPVLNDVYLAYHYYSELESGGHEAFLTWFSEQIEQMGPTTFLQKLIQSLTKINAKPYAKIVDTYGEALWKAYTALEKEEIEEDQFYNIIEKADNEYYQLNGELEKHLENYFVTIHTTQN
ncbi:DMP19 family protein [Bacillus sp. FJAT-45066]|uniref:DMP19 family protein n=1 Tax=Bacillus sp. FJAT-45066 TaxID=2011010 RepID=UPI000BB7DDB1|nr:DUF4375 domain-containing protein [Bacillus sp. FJAT-45066]